MAPPGAAPSVRLTVAQNQIGGEESIVEHEEIWLLNNLARGGTEPLVRVHPRVTQKRPEITDADVLKVFHNAMKAQGRAGTDPLQLVGFGIDDNGRTLEWVAAEEGSNRWLVYHCSSISPAILTELGLGTQRKKGRKK